MIRNILLKIKYDGSDFHGWQRQPNLPTVQGEVERVLGILCAQKVELNGTSRTDAGVHAFGQQASFTGDFSIPTENIMRAANGLLHPAIQITEVKEVDLDFHARFDSKGKTYIYKISNTTKADPFRRKYWYFVKKALDINAMKEAAIILVGTHDFKCFQGAGGEERKTTVRTISKLNIFADDIDLETTSSSSNCDDDFKPVDITIEVTGDGFLYNMVRIIVGTLVDIGLGKLEPKDLEDIIKSKDRSKAGHTAPPQGLYLKEIYY